MKTALLLALAFLTAGAFSSCNTAAGLGQDMSKLGNKIEDKANEAR